MTRIRPYQLTPEGTLPGAGQGMSKALERIRQNLRLKQGPLEGGDQAGLTDPQIGLPPSAELMTNRPWRPKP